jgi:putative addiction module CopG family antidote
MSIEITLGPELGKFIEQKVQSGEFSNPSDVVGSALAILQEQEMARPEDSEELREQIAIGINAFERGDCAPWNVDEIKTKLTKRFATNHS